MCYNLMQFTYSHAGNIKHISICVFILFFQIYILHTNMLYERINVKKLVI